MNDVLRAIENCRSILRQFIAADLDYAAFKERMANVMAPLDPLDWALEGLTRAHQLEATMYVEWLGGEFGETKDRIPRRSDWVYGDDSNEPYGWVDQDEYRRRLRAAFKGVLGSDT